MSGQEQVESRLRHAFRVNPDRTVRDLAHAAGVDEEDAIEWLAAQANVSVDSSERPSAPMVAA